jgi:bacillopeptidase F (M6 metalloprotease family)
MSVIAIQNEPHRVTRMFFDCCDAAVDPMDQRRIAAAIEHSIDLAAPEGDAPEFLLMAGA